MKFRFLAALVVLGLLTSPAFPQGTQTGAVTGTVRSADGQTLPGVSISVKSPALIGARTSVSDSNGSYIFKGLPPGEYTVTYELSGFSNLEHKTTVSLGVNATVDAKMSVSTVQETITVTGEAPSVIESSSGGETYTGDKIDTLATGRTLAGIANLAPGVTDNTPNNGQLTISGAFAYDNVFLVDGVDVNDNLFGTANNVYIEEAVDQTQVLTSGISAEFGRFSGGVVNALTKRGGNEFSGSFRVDFTNASWTKETPFEVENDIDLKSKLNKVYSETFGGPVLKDRLWFFAAARQSNVTTQDTFEFSGIAHSDVLENKRFEGKLTGAINSKNTLQASYTRNTTDDTSPTFDFSIDPRTVSTFHEPNELFVATYSGVLRPDLFLEAQYSQQKFEFAEGGGSSTNRPDSPFFTFGVTAPPGQHYNAPYFGFSVDPESRKNRQIAASLSYFLTSQKLGKHDLKGGFESYRSTRIGGNTQSSTGFVYYADYVTDANGDPVLDASGGETPVWEPEQNLFVNWIATPGATLNITTNSFYLNDKISAGSHWSFGLGVRYEKVRSEATGGLVGVDTDTIVPRLSTAFDVKGDGKYTLKASYAHYAGKYSESQFGNNTTVGNPSYVYGLYIGPSGVGNDFAPGLDTNNYFFLAAGLPDKNVSFEKGLSSPITKEFTVAGALKLGSKGYGQLLYTHRKTSNFVEDFFNIDQGFVDVTLPTECLGCDGTVTLDRRVFANSDVPERVYEGIQAQIGYRVTTNWDLQGSWTHQFKLDGNFEGEASNQPGISSSLGDYPEILTEERNFPTGHLSGFQKDKVRLWTTYDLGLGKFGNLNVGALYRYDSPTTFSLFTRRVDVSDIQASRDPGYATPPNLQTLYYGSRGSGFYKGASLVDLAFTYSVPVYKKARPYVKFDVRNVFNDQTLGAGVNGFNTTVTPDSDGPLDSNGLPTNYVQGTNFGKATSAGSYPVARTIRFAVGFRF